MFNTAGSGDYMFDDAASRTYERRVAEVYSLVGAFVGYLLVRPQRLARRGRETSPTKGLDLLMVRRGREEDSSDWSFSDRADPPDYDTVSELEGGYVNWYGVRLRLVWLDEPRSAEIEEKLFC